MKIQINLELNEAMCLIAAYASDSELRCEEITCRAEAVIDKITEQVDDFVAGLELEAERKEG